MSGGIRLFSVRGVPIRLHWTFFLVLPWLAFAMARQFAAFAANAHTSRDALLLSPGTWGFVLAVLLFASVLLHELGHVFVARSQGSHVHEVTLMLLGGVSHIGQVSREPRAEAKMAVVGPLVSIAIAIVAYAAHLVFEGIAPDLQFGLYYLAHINLAIGLFNLLPAFPLDGGRVLRSVMEPRHGRVRATAIAATVGRVLAVAMGVWGLLSGNFMLMLIALFVWGGGTAEAVAVIQREKLEGVRVLELTDTDVPPVYGAETLRRAGDVMLATRSPVLLVRGPEGGVGVVTADDIARVPERDRDARTVDQVARFDLPLADASDLVNDALDAMDQRQLAYVPVVRGTWVVGVLSRETVFRAAQLDTTLRPSMGNRPSTA